MRLAANPEPSTLLAGFVGECGPKQDQSPAETITRAGMVQSRCGMDRAGSSFIVAGGKKRRQSPILDRYQRLNNPLLSLSHWLWKTCLIAHPTFKDRG
jgi:hypothetical protein